MLLGGLWHGAAWNYVLWGAYQGTLLCVHRFATGGRDPLPSQETVRRPYGENEEKIALARLLSSRLSGSLQIAGFFLVTCYGWLLFRAHSFERITEFTSA